MDFVISKVAMSICALLVVSIIGGLVGTNMFIRPDTDLSGILDTLFENVQATVRSGTGSMMTWIVPCLSGGKPVELSVHNDFVRTVSEGRTYVMCLGVRLHFWIWDGTPLNDTRLEALDDEAGVLRAVSGQALEISCQRILFDNELKGLAFVHVAR